MQTLAACLAAGANSGYANSKQVHSEERLGLAADGSWMLHLSPAHLMMTMTGSAVTAHIDGAVMSARQHSHLAGGQHMPRGSRPALWGL